MTATSVASSTARYYGQEPFKTFKHKVKDICTEKFGACDIQVSHMTGGSCNRVVAVTVTPSALPESKKWSATWWFAKTATIFWLPINCVLQRKKQKKKMAKDYVVRIPRNREADCDILNEVALLDAARPHLKTSIPKVAVFDATAANALCSPYTILERLEGQTLMTLWEGGLNTLQRLSAARQMITIMTQLRACTSPEAGIVAPAASPALPFKVDKFPTLLPRGHPNTSKLRPRAPNAPQTTFDFLLEQCSRQIEFDSICNLDGFIMPEWYKIRCVINAMRTLGFLPDDEKFYLCHKDLFPRNIMARISDNNSVQITGVLDWDPDFCFFCPKFVAFGAPFWFWNSAHEDPYEAERKEQLTLTEPKNEQDKLMKDLFDSVSTSEWKKYAYSPEYIIARRLFWLLKDGLRSNDAITDMEDIIRDWHALHPQLELQANYWFDGPDEGYLDVVEDENTDADTDTGTDTDIEDLSSEVGEMDNTSESHAEKDSTRPSTSCSPSSSLVIIPVPGNLDVSPYYLTPSSLDKTSSDIRYDDGRTHSDSFNAEKV
ncbi:hypothetical protein P280DRAFT_472811 [Massarina eburnea CBS 473.64]|uniref:Aminoglycoside phosphotransferase domain-containing protein n=1 Tax=Massarina eburnea CBS 473.64 TaxID=1395130 RepID=A0A6A6RRC5_9PLEO|nr:hypothetical protein P280DRAFT_472811 [Massarina eburnea CBS 473.64]